MFVVSSSDDKNGEITGNGGIWSDDGSSDGSKSESDAGKPALQPRRNQSVVRQPTAFKSERPSLSKQRFASQVDVNNDLSKPVTTQYLPKERESAVAKPHHMIAPGSSRYSSNDMVHNHYLEEAKKKTQESSRNSEPSVMPSARSQSTANGSKPKPRINNQKSRNWPASKSSCVTTKTVPIAEHSRNSRSFSDYKHFVCSTCQKCVFNANHDSCVTKFLNEVNSRAKVPSNKTTKRYIPVEQTSFAKKPERQIPKRHRSSIKKTSVVHEKTMTPRSCLRWKPTVNPKMASVANDTSGLVPQRQKASDYDNPDPAPELQNVSPSADTTVPSQQELDLLFGPLYDEFFNDGTSRVNKSSSPTDNSVPQDTHPSTNIQPTSEPSTPTNAHAEENNVDQAEFTNPFCTPGEVYVAQPDGFVDPDHPKKVYRLRKALYGLKQAPRAWYDELSKFMISKGFTKAFSDADHAGCVDIRKSTSGGIQFLGDKLVSWMSKKQDCTAMSSAEAEYVALSTSCAQVMWMRTQLKDYGFNYNKIPLYWRLSVSHDNLMQPRVALLYQAHPYTVSIFVRHVYWYEMFDSQQNWKVPDK
ncbi:retrovirus-related pol polyprotein from transposon TNT 1-94 [Tanacetum coccineum]